MTTSVTIDIKLILALNTCRTYTDRTCASDTFRTSLLACNTLVLLSQKITWRVCQIINGVVTC